MAVSLGRVRLPSRTSRQRVSTRLACEKRRDRCRPDWKRPKRWGREGAEKIKAELYGIFAGGVGELVGEGLKDPGVGIGTGGPKSVGWKPRGMRDAPKKKS